MAPHLSGTPRSVGSQRACVVLGDYSVIRARHTIRMEFSCVRDDGEYLSVRLVPAKAGHAELEPCIRWARHTSPSLLDIWTPIRARLAV